MQSDGGHSLTSEAARVDAGVVSRDVCPLCRSGSRSRFRLVERGDASHELVKCGDCGFVYAATARFDTADHGDLSKLYWRFRSRHHQIRRLIHLHLRSGAQVVEIGCGRGELGYIMKDDPYRYTGYEPAAGLSRFGQLHGVNVVHDFFTAETAPAADAVVIDNVLEHVLDPQQLLADAVASLRAGGLAIVIVPNRDDLRQMAPSWRDARHWIPPDHINYFSRTDVQRMFANCGLKARPFAFHALSVRDYRYFPRAVLETLGISVLGHNVFAVKPERANTESMLTQ